uniref:Cell division protein ZipA n=1 Tax=Candidatus Kentrum sp. FW TaxID=2126338 RepID=A0A450RUI9_9GAMM|nr:MAG: cell division protein ZipA [Candidatus Kentron sp. FW]
MDNLRLILFISGILVIAAIYAWEVLRGRRADAYQRRKKSEAPDGIPPLDDPMDNNPPPLQDPVKDELYSDTDMQYWNRLDETANGTSDKDKVVLGDLNTLDSADAKTDLAITTSPENDQGILPTEEADITDDGATTTQLEAADHYRSLVEKIRIRRHRTERAGPGKDRVEKASPAVKKELFIALTIIARPSRQFAGTEIHEQMEKVDMRLGDMQIFHHFGMADQQTEQPVFSVADILEPGTFSPDEIENHSTKGLALFMKLPGPMDGLVAFELMLNTAQQLAKALDGELCDDTRSTLTTQSANHLRERIEELKRKQLV